MMFALFFLICVAASAAIAIVLRDDYIFKRLNKYITLLQTYGDDSIEEYQFRERTSGVFADLCHLVRASRDDGKLSTKNKRTPRSNRGKK